MTTPGQSGSMVYKLVSLQATSSYYESKITIMCMITWEEGKA